MNAAPTILIIDDNPDDRLLAARELHRELPQAVLRDISTDAQFQGALAEGRFDLVVTDFALNWSNGLNVLRAVRSTYPDVPVIMFTGSGTQEVAVEAMKEGLDDYIVKSPTHFVRLGAAVQASLRRRQMQRLYQRTELRLQQLLTRLSVAIYRIAPGGKLLECNPALLRIAGVQHFAEMGSLDVSPLQLPADEWERLSGLPKDGSHVATWQTTLRRPDGTPVVVSISATLSTFNNEIVADCMLEDITESRRMLQELERANRAKDEFLAVLSHELRTPLTPVVSIASMLEKQTELPERVREDISILRRNAELEVRLIDDLLDLTRVAKGKLLLDLRAVDVHQTIERGWQTCCPPDAERQNIRFHAELRAEQHVVWADQERLQQVLMNLMTNALKFTPAGGSITVSTRNVESNIVIDVVDSGIGIEPELLGRIFDPFEQGHGSRDRNRSGLGLGLSIARRLVEIHKGTIAAESAGRGRGARFTLTLPLHEGPEQAGASVASAGGLGRQLPPLAILLVEDHADTARAVKRLLEMLGNGVVAAGSVAGALDLLARERFDVVISDIGLPDGSGTELAEKIAASRRPIPAIALSGFGTEQDIQRSKAAGFAAHLTKPVNIDQLERALQQIRR